MPYDTHTTAAPETVLAEGLNAVIDNLDHWSRNQIKVHLMGLQAVLDQVHVDRLSHDTLTEAPDPSEPRHDPIVQDVRRALWSEFITDDPILDAMRYDTVLGWLAKNAPRYLADLEDPVEDTKRDGFWLTHRCNERGWEVIKVQSPGVMPSGLPTVNAYPVEMIRERFERKGAIS